MMDNKHPRAFITEEYKEWLKRKKVSKPAPYCDYINKALYSHKEFKDVLYADIIVTFLQLGQPAYANVIMTEMREKCANTNKNQSYQKKFEHFIYCQNSRGLYTKNSCKKVKVNSRLIDYIIGTVKKESSDFGIDAMTTLLQELGTKRFVRLAIESSYFFSVDIVNKRHEEIKNMLNEGKEIVQRKSKKTSSDNTRNVDEAGNSKIIPLMNKLSGYTAAIGEKSTFHNFIISHIWGNATDYRFFSEFWNIVLVPAWANHLLDKNDKSGLAAVLKETYKAICRKLYNTMNGIEKCPVEPPTTSFQYGTYNIWIIKALDKEILPFKVSSIEKKQIRISREPAINGKN